MNLVQNQKFDRSLSDMAQAETFFELLDSDIRLLSAEVKKFDGFAYQITGLFNQAEVSAIKESCEKSLTRLRILANGDQKSMGGIRDSPDLLKPFLTACATKNGKMASIALSTFQKFAANDGLSTESRSAVLKALLVAERIREENVGLRVLQTALTLMQNPLFADDEEGICQMLGLVFRIHAYSSKGMNQGGASGNSSTLLGTAAATVRQAVALVFDHAILPCFPTPTAAAPLILHGGGHAASTSGGMCSKDIATGLPRFGDMIGRESVALSLLLDIVSIASGGGGGYGGAAYHASHVAAAALLQQVTSASSISSTPSSRSGSIKQGSLNGLVGSSIDMAAGFASNSSLWLRLSGGTGGPNAWPLPPRTFMLELLESVLSQRYNVFHKLPQLTVALRQKVCPFLDGMLRSALEPNVDPASIVDVRLVIRCAGAMLKRHHLLAPDKCSSFMQALLRSAVGTLCQPWQRIAVLQVLRGLCADSALVYKLFEMYDLAMDFDLNALGDLVCGLADVCKSLLRIADENLEDDIMGALASTFSSKSEGRDIALEAEAMGPVVPGSEIVIGFQALEGLLSVVNSLELLSEALSESGDLKTASTCNVDNTPSPPSASSVPHHHVSSNEASRANVASSPEKLSDDAAVTRLVTAISDAGVKSSATSGTGTLLAVDGTRSQSILASLPLKGIQRDVLANMVDALWRHVLPALSSLLVRCMWGEGMEVLGAALLRAYQQFIYSAGILGSGVARDKMLSSLCEFTLMDPPEEPQPGLSGQEGLLISRPAGKSAALLYTLNPDAVVPVDAVTMLSARNVAALKALFHVAHLLAPVLPASAWLHVVDVLNCLDKVLLSPFTTSELDQDTAAVAAGLQSYDSYQPATSVAQSGGSSSSTPISEISLLASAVDSIFEATSSLPTEAVLSLLSALGEVSAKSLPTQAAVGAPRLHALKRMVDILLVNVHRIHELWPIFLAHVLEILHSPIKAVRAVALDALRKSVIGSLTLGAASLSAFPTPTPTHVSAPSPAYVNSALLQAGDDAYHHLPQQTSSVVLFSASLEASSLHQADRDMCSAVEDLENMLLVALDSLYSQNPEPDVRRGLIKIAIDVLHHNGHHLTRGWLPLMRLLEAVPVAGQEAAAVSLAFQCVQLIVSDFLPILPKEHVPKILDVVALFAKQDIILNVSLTAVTILWNVSDQLARKKPQSSATSLVTTERTASLLLPVSRSEHCVDELRDGSLELLRIAFRALHAASGDLRPEVRNSGIRTLFLAISSNGHKLQSSTWREVLWDMALPLLKHTQLMAVTSSSQEVMASELGRVGGGRTVMMLMHHSRNTEQKQWDETLVLVLSGLTKVLRSYLPQLLELRGFKEAWADIIEVLRTVLSDSRKGPSCAATNLLAAVVQAQGPAVVPPVLTGASGSTPEELGSSNSGGASPQQLKSGSEAFGATHSMAKRSINISENYLEAQPYEQFDMRRPLGGTGAMPPWMWRGAMRALEEGVRSMTSPNTHAQIQARTELLACISTVYCTLREQLNAEDVKTFIRWLGRFVRYPTGVDDAGGASALAASGQLSPMQKNVLSVLSQLAPLPVVDAWSEAVTMLSDTLCPLKILPLRSGAALEARHPPAADGSAVFEPVMKPVASGSPSSSIDYEGAEKDEAEDLSLMARNLTSAWMIKASELLTAWYKGHVPWQVRVSTFPVIIARMSECMALRYLPSSSLDFAGPELWRTAARCFVSIVQSGLPSVNITMQSQLQQHGGEAAVGVGRRSSSSAGSSPLALESMAQSHGAQLQGSNPSGHPPGQQASPNGQQQQQLPATSTAWPLLAQAFEIFLLGGHDGVLSHLSPEKGCSGTAATVRAASTVAIPAPSLETAVQPSVQPGAGISAAPSQKLVLATAEDAEIQASVLDCLADTVLTSCQFAPQEIRQALIRVIDLGTRSSITPSSLTSSSSAMAPSIKVAAATNLESSTTSILQQSFDITLHASSRFSHLCLSKLYVLCCRGQDLPEPREQSTRCQMEIAQLALPVLITRADVILRHYAAEDRRLESLQALLEQSREHPISIVTDHDDDNKQNGMAGVSGAMAIDAGAVSTTQSSLSLSELRQLTEKARHVADLVMQLRVAPAVMDAAVKTMARGPQLRPWLDVARARRKRGGMAAASSDLSGGGAGVAAVGSASTGTWSVGSRGIVMAPLSTSRSNSGNEGSSIGATAIAAAGRMVNPKEQTHLLALYGALCEAVTRRDAIVRESAGIMLEQIGRDVGLLDFLGPAALSIVDA